VKRLDTLLPQNKERIVSRAEKRKEEQGKVSKAEKKKIITSLASNKKIQTAYAAKVANKTSVGIEGQLVFTDFFNMGTIGLDEPLIYTLDEPVEEAVINEISTHGGNPRETVINNTDYVQVSPYEISSPTRSMSKFSLRQGDISTEEKMLRGIEKGLAKRLDKDAKAILEAGITNNLAGIKGINVDPDVYDFPASNVLDFTAEGKVTLNVLKGIAAYMSVLGKKIRNVYIPATRRTDVWDFLSLPAGYSDGSGVTADSVVPQSLHEQVIRTGTLSNVFGYNMNLIPVNTLNGDPANGEVALWVSTTEAAGEYREIPKVTDTFVEEDKKRLYYTLNKGVAMFQTPNQRLNYAKVIIG
jgi:hypothetical protein